MDIGFIDIARFQRLAGEGVCYITKMKKNLEFEVQESVTCINAKGLTTHVNQHVRLTLGELPYKASRVEIFDERRSLSYCLPTILTSV